MSGNYFDNVDQFLSKFDFDRNGDYFDIHKLEDRKIGFSVKRRYPKTIRYRPALNGDGEPDNVAGIWVVYAHPDETGKTTDPRKVPVLVRIGNFSIYRAKHFDYDFQDEKSPTEASVRESNASPQPISLDYLNEFFYDHHKDSFVDQNGKEISSIDILNRVFQDHCDTVHRLKGLKLRWKLATQRKTVGALDVAVKFFVFVLKKIFGRTLDESDVFSSYFNGYEDEALKKLSTDTLNVFGYKASRSVILLFCGVVVVGAFIRYLMGASSDYVSYVTSNDFLSLVHGLVLIWLLDSMLPYVLFMLINGLIKLRTKVMFRRFKAP